MSTSHLSQHESSNDSFDDDDFSEEEDASLCSKVDKLKISNPNATKPSWYKILTFPQVVDEINRLYKSVSQLLKANQSAAEAVCKIHGFDENALQTLIENEEDNIQELINKYGHVDSMNKTKSLQCQICYDDYEVSQTKSLACNHAFCKDCWRVYIMSLIKSQGFNSAKAKCPSYNCDLIASDEFVKTCFDASERDMYDRYEKFLVDYFLNKCTRVLRCLSPRCDKFVAKVQDPDFESRVVVCACGEDFCFACNSENHKPASCEDKREWDKKLKSEAMSAGYLNFNTKNCPKCDVRIEKDRGCNHITCFSCKHNFCWVCNGNWDEHGVNTGGYYRCNNYKKIVEEKRASKTRNKKSSEHNKYIFYFERYSNHDKSMKFASQSYEKVESKIEELRRLNSNSNRNEFEYLKKVIDDMTFCRKVLKYTYVYGYFIENEVEKNFFEFLQQDLEKNTEILNEYVESPIEKIDKEKIMTQAAITKKFAISLLEGLSKGNK